MDLANVKDVIATNTTVNITTHAGHPSVKMVYVSIMETGPTTLSYVKVSS